MNTTVNSLQRLIAALEAMTPYQGLAECDAPAALRHELAEAVMAAPADFMNQHPEALGPILEWARNSTERRDYPEFFALMAEMRRIEAEEGEEALHGPEHLDLFTKLMESAPPRYRGEAETILADVLPTATHVNEDGQPLYSVQQIAEQFGVTPEAVEADIQRLQDNGMMEEARYTGPVHPLH